MGKTVRCVESGVESERESKRESTHLDRHLVMWLPGFLGDSSNVVHSDASSVERRAGQRRQLASGCVSELNKRVLRTLRKVSSSIQTYLSFCSWWRNVVLNNVITVNSVWVQIVAEGTYSTLCCILIYATKAEPATYIKSWHMELFLSSSSLKHACVYLTVCLKNQTAFDMIFVTFTKRESACFI